jgi:hypothetical protein
VDCRFRDYSVATKSDLIEIKAEIRDARSKTESLKYEIQSAERNRNHSIDQLNRHLETIKWDRFLILGILYLVTLVNLTTCHRSIDIKEKLDQLDPSALKSTSHATP